MWAIHPEEQIMRTHLSENLAAERAGNGVQVVRFTRPDLWKVIYEDADVEVMPLFNEIREAALHDLPNGGTLVINMGLVECFPAALYRCLLECRQILLAKRAKLVLCGLNDRNTELFRLLRGDRVFAVANSESEAIRAAGRDAAATKSASANELRKVLAATPATGPNGVSGSGARRLIASMRRFGAVRSTA
jgi:anti-anti-sigma regulatory factor